MNAEPHLSPRNLGASPGTDNWPITSPRVQTVCSGQWVCYTRR